MRAAHSSSRTGWIAGISIVALTPLGSAFLMLHGCGPNPDMVKTRIQAELDAIRKLPPIELDRKDKYLEELLVDPEWRYAFSIRKQVEKEHATVHEAARLDKQGAQDVPPFLRKVDIVRATPKDFRSQASELKDEARALWERYATTRFGADLQALHRELEETASRQGGWEREWVPLQKRVQDLIGKKDFAQAERALEDFGVRHGAADDPALCRQMQKERESIARVSSKAAGNLRASGSLR